MPDQPPPLETKVYDIDPRELRYLERNARHMGHREFQQLVENIKADGALTSTPLVYRTEDGLTVLSGNHRTKAAVAAGLASIAVMEVIGDLDEARRVAIQLSHNAITGEDDQNVLRELYESLDVLGQRYSGLTDHDFSVLEDLDLSKLSLGQPAYEIVQLMFLPEDREIFIDAMQKLGKGAAKAKRYIGRLEDYERFEHAIVTVQDSLDIHNQALALLAMSELALERLDELEGANGDGRTAEQSSQTEGLSAAAEPADAQAD